MTSKAGRLARLWHSALCAGFRVWTKRATAPRVRALGSPSLGRSLRKGHKVGVKLTRFIVKRYPNNLIPFCDGRLGHKSAAQWVIVRPGDLARLPKLANERRISN